MFKNETVFILGAGASWHYGYPTGDDLVRMVIKKSRELANFSGLYREIEIPASAASVFPDYIYARNNLSTEGSVDHHRDAWNNLYVECMHLANRLGTVNPPVIDYFLDWNVPLHDIGKLTIAWVILECEAVHRAEKGNVNRRTILENSPDRAVQESSHRIDVTKYKDDWYRFILYKIASECEQSKSLLENKVTFVTFNYDVSLENYLYQGLSSIDLFERDTGLINEFLGSDRVFHVYGKVRENPFEDTEYGTLGRGKPYKISEASIIASLTPQYYEGLNDHYKRYSKEYQPYYKEAFEQAYLAPKNIQTIGSTKHHQIEIIESAKKVIGRADCVYIIGYGFDEQNSNRLDLNGSLRIKSLPNSPPPVLFTNFEDNNLINKRASRVFLGHESGFLPTRSLQGGLAEGHNHYYEKSIRNAYDAFERDFDSMENQITYRSLARRMLST